jgi:hypothetical protein
MARHQNAAVANLLQALITTSIGKIMAAFQQIINKLGVTTKRQLSVAAFNKGTTIGCKPRLDLTLCCNPEYDIYCLRVN